MKLLFDQNLSHCLVGQLAAEFPGSTHVSEVGLAAAADQDVWAYAAANGFVIVSKDTDFQQRALLYGHPPKVILAPAGERPDGDSSGRAQSAIGRHSGV
jgi:predicted nuclease of predicted toxin-antitoxin system